MIRNLILTLLIISLISACSNRNNDYYVELDKKTYFTPKERFSELYISQKERFEQNITFSRDGKLCIVGLSDSTWNYKGLLKYSYSDAEWKLDDTINFGFDFIGEAIFSTTTNKLFFIAFVPTENNGFQTDIYSVDYKNGGFGKVEIMDSNVVSNFSEWHPSVAKNGNLYFSSERRGGGKIMSDIYVSEFVDNKYQEAIRLPEPVNTDKNDSDPLIAPDESYLIVQSDRKGGYGKHDFYVSFKDANGNWTEPCNLGAEINTEQWEIGPSFSPDFKYIFFTRRKEWKTDESSDIYRFSVEEIEKLRNSNTQQCIKNISGSVVYEAL